MKSYRQTLIHLVFATNNRVPSLLASERERLYRYIWGICKDEECHLLRIGGHDDHIHLLFDLHPSRALADFVRKVKGDHHGGFGEENVFPLFESWQKGYAAFSVGHEERERIVKYIKGQEEHHKAVSFLDEYKQLLDEMGMELDPRYLP